MLPHQQKIHFFSMSIRLPPFTFVPRRTFVFLPKGSSQSFYSPFIYSQFINNILSTMSLTCIASYGDTMF